MQISCLWTIVVTFNLVWTVKISNLYHIGQINNMVISSFAVTELLNLLGTLMTSKLPQQTCLRLKSLGPATTCPTRRGVRGGVHKQGTISTILNRTLWTTVIAPASRGVVQSNLVHINRAPVLPALITEPGVREWIKPNRTANHNKLKAVGRHSEVKATPDWGLVKAMHL